MSKETTRSIGQELTLDELVQAAQRFSERADQMSLTAEVNDSDCDEEDISEEEVLEAIASIRANFWKLSKFLPEKK